jgi:hypothetical protein
MAPKAAAKTPTSRKPQRPPPTERELTEFIESIKTFFKNLFIILLLIIAAIVIYHVVIKGYPNFFVNLATLHFYHEEDLDKFIKDEEKLAHHFKFLMYEKNAPSRKANFKKCTVTDLESNQLLKKQILFNGAKFCDLLDEIKELMMNTYTNVSTESDRYYMMLREYYLFYEKIHVADTEDLNKDGKTITILNRSFYGYLRYYKEKEGTMTISTIDKASNLEKGTDALNVDFYLDELKKGTRNNLLKIQSKLDEFRTIIEKEIINSNTIKALLPLLFIPNDKEIDAIDKIMSTNVTNKELSDITWAILECKAEESYKYLAHEITVLLHAIKTVEKPENLRDFDAKIRNYINVTSDLKSEAEKRIINIAIKERCKDKDKCKYKLVRQHEKTYDALFEFIKKRPIFSNVYFSTTIGAEAKEQVYKTIIATYHELGLNTSLKLFHDNAIQFKRIILSSTIIYLYLGFYRADMTKMYNSKYLSPDDFFNAMWKPYRDDVWKNKVKFAFDKTFNKRNFNSAQKKFNVWYKQLGKDLNRMIKAVFKAFFTSTPVEKPKEESVE